MKPNSLKISRLPAALRGALAASAVLLALPAVADDPYLFDVMKQPAYRKAYVTMLAGATHLPSWLGQITHGGNYVATPVTKATVGGTSYSFFHACKAHDCAGHELEVMFTPDASKAYGLVIDGNSAKRWLGVPDSDQQAALLKAQQAD
jgi:hypothetical protein